MKKILLAGLYIFSLFSPVLLKAQTSFSLQSAPSDSITYTYTGLGEYPDNITNTTTIADSITITWHVVNTDFPAGWLTSSAFGFCDNVTCYNNYANGLWNGSTGGPHTSAGFKHDSTCLFSPSLALPPSAAAACYWVQVAASVTGSIGGAIDTVTFVICQPATSGVTNIAGAESNVILYPNPARDELNLVYDANADVKNIAVYNIIGKIMAVYRVTGNSANLNLENVPAGFYFVRLSNSYGQVVATKKFTKQ